MQCIYCLQEKGSASFTKAEHVIPESFGKFKNNFVLYEVVCDECNQYFGDNLEINLARDTYEGSIAMYEYKIKKPSEFKSIGKKSRIKIIVQEGLLKGAYAYPEYVPQEKKICLKPLPQVGFLKVDSREYDYFLLDEIPSALFFNNRVHNINTPRGITTLGCDHETAADALRRKGFSLRSGANRDCLYVQPGQSKIYGKNDQKIARAIAKIGFNYLAYWEGSKFVLRNDFDPIRKYIIAGQKPDYSVISVNKTAILPEEREIGYRKLGHIVITHSMFNGTLPFVFISLFNWASYAICLANKFSGEKKDIARGHFFNLYDKSIKEFKRS